jgi:urease accessory protein
VGVLDQGLTTGHQRTAGRAEVALSFRGGRTRLDRLHQSGAAKVMLPNAYAADPEVVFLNTAGGLTGGDHLRYGVEVGPGARVVATTQAAERIYDCAGDTARVSVRSSVGAGGRLDWLPQETIVYDGAALDRRTRIDLSGGATCLALEVLVFGRLAMGERVLRLSLHDRREIRRDGVPVLIDPLAFGAAHLAPRRAGLRGANAVASLALVGDGVEDAASAISGIAVEGVEAGVSGWDGRMTLRAFAANAMPLRRYVVAVLERLRGRPAPRVWQP